MSPGLSATRMVLDHLLGIVAGSIKAEAPKAIVCTTQ